MPLSQQLDRNILDLLLYTLASLAEPTAWFIGFSSSTPTKTGTNVTEPSGNGYARVELASANVDDPQTKAAPVTIANVNQINFAAASADWGSGPPDLTHLVFYDAIASGTFLGYQAVTVAKPVHGGDVPFIGAGQLTFSIS